jgi:alkylation response protein AidB-like acyl-CoA dehydrogenase
VIGSLNEEQLAFKEMAAAFARDELAPYAAKWDKEDIFPVDVLRKAAELGLAGIYASEKMGGSGLHRLDAAILFEELSTECISTSAYLSIHNMVVGLIDKYASDAIQSKYGQRLTSMEWLSSYCLTEPSSGSDAASLKTSAVLQDDHYVLNGSKAFISGAGVSDLYLVMARTGDESHRGISCFVVEKNFEGITFGKKEEKLGWHSQPTAMVFFENCKVPKENLVGAEGEGFKIALNGLNGGRINIAACSLGGAKACLRVVKQYMDERKQFGKSLSQFQALRFRYAEMLTQFEAARMMVHRAAASYDANHEQLPLHCAMAKKFATDAAFEIANHSLQLLGGYGYLQDYPIERIFRDLRVHQILEGTNEIMCEIISKIVLKEEFYID